MKFSDKLKKLRNDLNLSQGELAEKIGVTTRTIAAYEGGECTPRYSKTYKKLGEALGVDPEYLASESDDEAWEADENGEGQGGQDPSARKPKGHRRSKVILGDSESLFMGGELSTEDADAFVRDMEQLFVDACGKTAKKDPGRQSDAPSDD